MIIIAKFPEIVISRSFSRQSEKENETCSAFNDKLNELRFVYWIKLPDYLID